MMMNPKEKQLTYYVVTEIGDIHPKQTSSRFSSVKLLSFSKRQAQKSASFIVQYLVK